MAREQLSRVCLEKYHFEQEVFECANKSISEKFNIDNVRHLYRLVTNLAIIDNSIPSTIWHRYANAIRNKFYRLMVYLRLRQKFDYSYDNLIDIFYNLDSIIYDKVIEELKKTIMNCEEKLRRNDAQSLMDSLQNDSMLFLKAKVHDSFKSKRNKYTDFRDAMRRIKDFHKDYPLVLSTTNSARSCTNIGSLYDYVIMDEASQVDVCSGFLSLTCAENAVIVGDKAQLPNVMPDNIKTILSVISKQCFNDAYDVTKNSFLTSICGVLGNVSQTYLREHYRCHPEIIGFCNQQFYEGRLIIMTNSKDGDSKVDAQPLYLFSTKEGHHRYSGNINFREIDTIEHEVFEELQIDQDSYDSVGIIAPYKGQVQKLKERFPFIKCGTVHSFQGQEKDIIIMSIVDDEISEFTDDPHLVNVAVSRAVKKFCLVVTGNKQSRKGCIDSLSKYINRHKGEVNRSKLYSIFDSLSEQKEKFSIGNRSDLTPAEKKTQDLICSILGKRSEFSCMGFHSHYQLRYLISKRCFLSDKERKYAMNTLTHVDFLIFNRVTNEPILVIETDGYTYHKKGTVQYERDKMKDEILRKCDLPIIRLSTTGFNEEGKIIDALNRIIQK